MTDEKERRALSVLLSMSPDALAGLALAMMQVAYQDDEVKIEEMICRYHKRIQPTVN